MIDYTDSEKGLKMVKFLDEEYKNVGQVIDRFALVPKRTVYNRLKKGWDLESACTILPNESKPVEKMRILFLHSTKKFTPKQISKLVGVSLKRVYSIIK